MKSWFITLCALCTVIISNGQVHLQSGAAQYGIPLYSYSDPNNRLNTSVSLSYSAGNGLKVSEIPSSTGAGWSIDYGGYIQRIQHGEPDDQKNNDTYVYPWDITSEQQDIEFVNWAKNYYPNGILYSEYSATQTIYNGGAYFPYVKNSGATYKQHPQFLADREHDVFSFSFNGRTGFFIISKKQSGVSEIRTLVDSKLKIQEIYGDLNNTNNIRTTISEFQITDESGIKYIFKDAELSQIAQYNKGYTYLGNGNPTGTYPGYHYIPGYSLADGGGSSGYVDNPNFSAIKGELQNKFVKNKWFLSEIVNPLTGKKIVFEYEDYSFSFDGNKSVQRTYMNNQWTFALTIEKVGGIAKRLKKIILSPKETVEFNYSTANRIDFTPDKRLENLSVKYDGVIKYKWEFEHGYFVKNSVLPLNYNFTNEDKVWSRLCLTKLKKTGPGALSEPPYSFSYYIGNEGGMNSAVPPLFSYQQDFWGYYNPIGSEAGFYNPTAETHSLNYAPYEPYDGKLLSKEMYSWRAGYSWEYHNKPSLEARNGVLKTVTSPMGGDFTFEYEQNYFTASQLNLQGNGGVRVNKTIEYDGIDHAKDKIVEYKYIKEDGSPSAWGYENTNIQSSEAMKVYKKCGDKKFPGVSIPELATAYNKYTEYSKVYNIAMDVYGGNRGELKEDFGIKSPLRQTMSMAINYFVNALIAQLIADALTPDWAEYTIQTWSSSPRSLNNPLPFQYSRVEVIHKLGSDNFGKTTHEFTTPNESNIKFAIDFPTQSSPFSSKQRYAYWLYGLEKVVSVYDKQNKLLSKTENEYNPIKDFDFDPKFASHKWEATKKTTDCNFTTGTTETSDISSNIYYPIFGRVELKSKKEYVYNNTDFAYSLTEYEYSPKNYLLNKVKYTNSKGELVEELTYYPEDYTIGGAIQELKNNRIFDVPVSSQIFITKAGNQKYLLAGSVSEFAVLVNSDIKVVKTHTFRNDNPVIASSVAFNEGQLIPNTTYYKETGNFTYDNNGYAIQVNSDNEKGSTIYGYDNKLAIANIGNAENTEVAYTSFEDEGKGGWEFNTSNVVSEFSPTGRKCFSFTTQSSAEITRQINNSKTYILSFWAKGDEPFVYKDVYPPGIGFSKKVLNPPTGWTYYEYTVTGTGMIFISNSVSRGVSTSFYVDELRLCPKDARMKTVTYDPLVGKTSECDVNGRITYYEYDDLGRLHIIRDQNLNVIKAFEYQFKQ